MSDQDRLPVQASLFEEPELESSSVDAVSSGRSEPRRESIVIDDGELTLIHDWLTPDQSHQLFDTFTQELCWEQSQIQVYGRTVAIPRLNAWYGDQGCDYSYSGYRLPLNDWHVDLLGIRRRLQEELGVPMNSVLANLYRDGQDGVGWHSDDEPELGRNPTIASVSLGEERYFHLRRRQDDPKDTLKLLLPAGSLLVMSGAIQSFWQHCLPKSKKITQPRINLTFRHIMLK
ncbi:MAG: alpha-ketoglutarate-dependent dioxygenase AlkB [Cellvibrionaceae bacterium]|nr:alpha-ketoglutarate-dependent dioxygenase AlkB [Cellvibrionaceae bacterium]|tara:strand:- start:107575 stop:108267 length:693 start_codon:yes stop_codon:yes gene_type:complete